MRVLFVAPFFELSSEMGGMATAPGAWARALIQQGMEVDVITTPANRPQDLAVEHGVFTMQKGLRVMYCRRTRPTGNLFWSESLWRACRSLMGTYDAVHCIGLWTMPSIAAAWEARERGVPYVISLHGQLMPWAFGRHRIRKSFMMRLSERRRLERAAAVICTSPLEQRTFNTFGLSTPTTMVPNVVELRDVNRSEARERFRTRWSLGSSFVLLFAGRIVANKGLDITIEALHRMLNAGRNVRLVVAGPIEDQSGGLAKRRIQELRIRDRVTWVGHLREAEYVDAICGADVFVLNSKSENFAIGVAEALGYGCPVVLSDNIGVADWIRSYNAGVVVRRVPEATAESISQLIVDTELALRMVENGTRLVREEFSANVVGRKLAKLFESVARAETPASE